MGVVRMPPGRVLKIAYHFGRVSCCCCSCSSLLVVWRGWPPQVDEYFERETVDMSTIDTLAEVLPLGNLSDAAAVAEALARTAARAAVAEEEEGKGVPAAAAVLPEEVLEGDPAAPAIVLPEEVLEGAPAAAVVLPEEVLEGVPAAAVVLPGAGPVGAVAGLAGGLVELPGQRALLRLRKKCDAGAGE